MALLNSNNLKTLVALGDINRRKQFVCQATGFLVGFIAKNSKDPKKRNYYIFLVTNRHVFENKNQIFLRFNRKDGKTEIFRQDLFFPSKELRWLPHQNKKVDLALLNVSPKVLEQRDIDYSMFNEEMFAYHRNFSKMGIEIGDAVYIIGFPMGIAGKIQNFGCAKIGIISRTDNELIKSSKSFLIDSSIFPGNSGSPVLLKPTMESLQNTKAISQVYLLGVVSGYLPYEEKLFTHQTNPPSIVSLERENSGLSNVVPMDFVMQIYKNWIKKKKKLEKVQEESQKHTTRQEIKTSKE